MIKQYNIMVYKSTIVGWKGMWFTGSTMRLLGYTYKQKNDWTCGPAVARVVLDHFGKRLPISKLVRELKASPKGTWNKDIAKLFKKHDLDFKTKERATLYDIKRYLKNHIVLVAFWIPFHKESHYSIVTKIDNKRIYFHDTWFGSKHSYTHEHFLKNWWDEEAIRWLMAIEK